MWKAYLLTVYDVDKNVEKKYWVGNYPVLFTYLTIRSIHP